MARAVLDAALEDLLPDDEVRARLGLAKRERVGLGHRFSYLKAMDFVGSAELSAMRTVKKSGDDAIHVLPGTEADPDSLMRALLDSLNALEKYSQMDEHPSS